MARKRGLCFLFNVFLLVDSQGQLDDSTILNDTKKSNYDSNVTQVSPDWAVAYCKNVILTNPAYQACKDLLETAYVEAAIADCTVDLQSTGDVGWALAYVTGLTAVCVINAKADPAVWNGKGETPGEPDLPQALNTDLCTLECGLHGQCFKRTCKCDSGYGGEVCSLGPSTEPHISPAIETCNIETNECKSLIVNGQDLIQNDQLMCIIKYYKLQGDFTSQLQMDLSNSSFEKDEVNETKVPAVPVGLTTVFCPLSEKKTAKIRLANNGNISSAEYVLYVTYNATCRNCTTFGEKLTCTTKENYCFLDDLCIENGTPSASICDYCNASVDQHKWSKLQNVFCQPAPRPETSMFPSEVIYLMCGSLVIILAAVAIVIVLKKRKNNLLELGTATYSSSGGVILTKFLHWSDQRKQPDIDNLH